MHTSHMLDAGRTATPKRYAGGWAVPEDTPRTCAGPYTMPTLDVLWSGLSGQRMVCPTSYPTQAPQELCGHVAAVELDAQMVCP